MGRSLRLAVSLRQLEGRHACWPETTALSPILNDSEGACPLPTGEAPEDAEAGCVGVAFRV